MELRPDLYGEYAEAVRAIAATVPLVRADPEAVLAVFLKFSEPVDLADESYRAALEAVSEAGLDEGHSHLYTQSVVLGYVGYLLSDAFLNALTGDTYPELGEPWQAGVDVVRAK